MLNGPLVLVSFKLQNRLIQIKNWPGPLIKSQKSYYQIEFTMLY